MVFMFSGNFPENCPKIELVFRMEITSTNLKHSFQNVSMTSFLSGQFLGIFEKLLKF